MFPFIILAAVATAGWYRWDRRGGATPSGARPGGTSDILTSGTETSADGSRVVLWRVRVKNPGFASSPIVGEVSTDGGTRWTTILETDSTNEDGARFAALEHIQTIEGFE